MKLDLTTLRKLPVPAVQEAMGAFGRANWALGRGDEAAARRIADEVILCCGLGITPAELGSMSDALLELTRQRVSRGEKH